MAAVMRKDGHIAVGNTSAITYFDSWTITPAIGTADITAYGDSAKAFVSTLREWTVTASGTLDLSDTGQKDIMDDFTSTASSTTMNIYLFDRTTCYFSGTVLLTGGSIVSQVADKVTFSYNFQGSGALSYTTS